MVWFRVASKPNFYLNLTFLIEIAYDKFVIELQMYKFMKYLRQIKFTWTRYVLFRVYDRFAIGATCVSRSSRKTATIFCGMLSAPWGNLYDSTGLTRAITFVTVFFTASPPVAHAAPFRNWCKTDGLRSQFSFHENRSTGESRKRKPRRDNACRSRRAV